MSNIIQKDTPLYPKILWQRPVHAYKHGAGKIMILAGSKGSSGEAILTCEAVFRSGTGILLLGFPEGLKTLYKDILPESMTLELPETPGGTLAKKADQLILENINSCDAIIIGPGLSNNAETIQLIWELVFSIKKPIVLDSDGIYALTKGIEVLMSKEDEAFAADYLSKRHGELILCISPGEAKKILKALREEYKDQEITQKIAEKLGCTVVLKEHSPTMSTNKGLNITTLLGGPELAVGGLQSVLSGVIGSFVGGNPSSHPEAIATAVFLHTLAAKIASEKHEGKVILASDIVRYLPSAIKKAEE